MLYVGVKVKVTSVGYPTSGGSNDSFVSYSADASTGGGQMGRGRKCGIVRVGSVAWTTWFKLCKNIA